MRDKMTELANRLTPEQAIRLIDIACPLTEEERKISDDDLLAELMPWAVIDCEDNCVVVKRFGTEAEAVEWLGEHPNQAKVARGGFGIDG
jgi:hypothetical protein